MDIRQEQENTILGPVNAILEAGKFKSLEEEMDEGDIVIGEMTLYEKAIFTASHKAIDKYNEAVVKVRAGEIEADELGLTKSTIDSLLSLFWTSIKNRLGKPAMEPGAIGVRKGWQIVAMNGKEKDYDHLKVIRGLSPIKSPLAIKKRSLDR